MEREDGSRESFLIIGISGMFEGRGKKCRRKEVDHLMERGITTRKMAARSRERKIKGTGGWIRPGQQSKSVNGTGERGRTKEEKQWRVQSG